MSDVQEKAPGANRRDWDGNLTASTIPTIAALSSSEINEGQFQKHIESVLGGAPDQIVGDGKIHRFADDPTRPKSKAGWYILHALPSARGAFGTHRGGDIHHWHSGDRSQPKTDQEIAENEIAKREKQILDSNLKARAAREACALVDSAIEGDHPYLEKKQIGKALFHGDDVIVPIKDIHSTLCNVQRINADGKWFLPGGRVQGCFHLIGDIENAKRVIVCEGYATGKTIALATGLPVVCTMNCGNIEPVAKAISERYPRAEILIAGDNDAWTNGNPGVKKGTYAAKLVKSRFTVPVFRSPEQGQTDFNDLHCVDGLDSAAGQLDQAWHLEPERFSVNEVLELISGLSKQDRALQRSAWAKYLGLKVSELDALVGISEQPEGAPVKGAESEPWPEPVKGADLNGA